MEEGRITKLKVLGVHGLGDHRNNTWKDDWTAVVRSAFPGQAEGIELDFAFLTYDHIFEKVDISLWETMKAAWKLARSGSGTALDRRRGVLGDVSDRVKWTAGYVVAWVEDESFKRQTRKLVLDTLANERPDLILAHSLGSLITYNALTHPDDGSRGPYRSVLAGWGRSRGSPAICAPKMAATKSRRRLRRREALPSGAVHLVAGPNSTARRGRCLRGLSDAAA